MLSIMEFFTSRPILDILIIVGFIGLVIFILAKRFVYVVNSTGLNEIGPAKFGKKSKSSPHSNCTYDKDIIEILTKQSEMINKVRDIKQGIIPAQMRFAESVGKQSRGLMQKNFLSHAEDNKLEMALYSEDFRLYKICLRIITDDMREYFEMIFRENHLAEKTEPEFQIYVDNSTKEIVQMATDTLNEFYFGKTITRMAIFKANKEITHEIEQHCGQILHGARNIAMKGLADAAKLEAEFNVYFSKKIG